MGLFPRPRSSAEESVSALYALATPTAERPRQSSSSSAQAPREPAPALAEGPQCPREEDPKQQQPSYLSPHEGLVGSADDEIRPDDMQDLQRYQKPIEEPPGRVRTNQLPAFKERCIQNPRRDPERRYRWAGRAPSSDNWPRTQRLVAPLSICCSSAVSETVQPPLARVRKQTEAN